MTQLYRVLVLVDRGYEAGARWEIADAGLKYQEALDSARDLFSSGFNPTPGGYFRVFGTKIEEQF